MNEITIKWNLDKDENSNTDDLKKLINLRELITYGQVLIEFNDDSITLTGYEGDYKGTYSFDVDLSDYSGRNFKRLQQFARFLSMLTYMLEADRSKHSDYRLHIGADPNGDKQWDDLMKIIDKEMFDKLYEKGYNIVKRLD